MGIRSTMQMRLMNFVALMAMGVWAVTEVQELGNGDQSDSDSVSLDADSSDEHEFDNDSMGEGAGVGRRAAFLSTSGSFTLSSGSTTAVGPEEELGEGAGVGRRAAFLSTS